ncbi:MAG: hypothetical protein CXR30_00655 [Geobacter sp.]|nr:MAG: hypothetical protein CXR30_00655 [Geobacter sp.]
MQIHYPGGHGYFNLCNLAFYRYCRGTENHELPSNLTDSAGTPVIYGHSMTFKHYTAASGGPGLKVSWQMVGIRKDQSREIQAGMLAAAPTSSCFWRMAVLM